MNTIYLIFVPVVLYSGMKILYLNDGIITVTEEEHKRSCVIRLKNMQLAEGIVQAYPASTPTTILRLGLTL